MPQSSAHGRSFDGAPVSDPARIMGMACAGSETGAPDRTFAEPN